jgi:hypothetical protein
LNGSITLFIRLCFSVHLKPFKLHLISADAVHLGNLPPGSGVLFPAGTWPSNASALAAFDVTLPTNFDLVPTLTDGSQHPEAKAAAASKEANMKTVHTI